MKIKTAIRKGKPFFVIETASCNYGFYDEAKAKAQLERLTGSKSTPSRDDAPLVKPSASDLYEREGWQL